MDKDRVDEFSWDSLCDLCAGILLVEAIAAGPLYAYAVSCEVHGLVGLMTKKLED